MENPKYEMMQEMIDIYYGAKTNYNGLMAVIVKLNDQAYSGAENEKSIYSRRILSSYNSIIRDLNAETLVNIPTFPLDSDSIKRELSAPVLFGMLLGIANEKLDITMI